jgi:uncharacterized protein
MKYPTKDVRFDVKTIDETGQFEGFASVYGNVDQGGDIVEPGAFTRTIKNNGNEIPILWQHDSGLSIGLGTVEDSKKGLIIRGQLELDLPEAKAAYIRLKKGLVKGLSIGYKTVKDTIENGVRHIKEAKLYETSLVTFPMNELAQVTSVKHDRGELKMDFATALDQLEAMDGLDDAMDALCKSLCSIIWDSNLSDDEKIQQADTTLTQFHDEYMASLPDFLAIMDAMSGGMMMMANIPAEMKEGRSLSKVTRDRISAAIESLRGLPELPKISEAITNLQALMEDEPADKGTSSPGPAAQHSSDPDKIHSLLKLLEKELIPC